jgi:diaminopimelate decarboxylase
MTEFDVQGITASELARRFGTPLYVYDGDELTGRLTALLDAMHPRLEVFFSLKANPNIALCALLHSRGARAEVSSMTELTTALRAARGRRGHHLPRPGQEPRRTDRLSGSRRVCDRL